MNAIRSVLTLWASLKTYWWPTAHSPAMLFYLDNWLSTTPNPVAVNSPGFRKDQPALPLGGGLGVGHALGMGPLGQAAAAAKRPGQVVQRAREGRTAWTRTMGAS